MCSQVRGYAHYRCVLRQNAIRDHLHLAEDPAMPHRGEVDLQQLAPGHVHVVGGHRVRREMGLLVVHLPDVPVAEVPVVHHAIEHGEYNLVLLLIELIVGICIIW